MHEGHRERVKKRFEEEGLSSFTDIQALELLLFYALPRRDTNPLAHRLLKKFGSLKSLFEADVSDIASVEGIGENAALLIRLLPEMTRKFWIADAKGKQTIATVDQAVRFIKPILFGNPVESVYVFCLDNHFGVRHYDCVSQGTVSDVTIYLRKVAECAIRLNASKVLIAHNHPGGRPDPSGEDIRATRAIAEALYPLGIELADHIIFSDHSYFSFSQHHLLGKQSTNQPAHASGKSYKAKNE